MEPLIVRQLRGGHVESEHAVDAVLVDAGGRVLERIGEPRIATWRSAAKPFQLEVSLGLVPGEGLEAADLAVGASSHHGEPGHVARVEALLARFDRGVDHLYCGTHPPGDEAAAEALLRAGGHACALHNNCSGKHAFMAAASHARGWPADYRPPDHPLQQAILANLQARTGGAVVDAVIDGCGVPCWVLPLDGMARAWASLAATDALGRIGRAMRENPWLVSGTHAIDGSLMGQATRPLVAKVGAEGLLCLALLDEGLGIALKARTGSDKARAVAVHAILDRWFPGLVAPEHAAPWRAVTNWVGTACGEWTVAGATAPRAPG